jgi:glycosyltransferase involved in cell wall biosynthesis
MPQVSVIIPVYNTEKYIGKAIASILAQTFTDLELILVDDASTDNTYAICQKYAEADPRIRLYKNEKNLGMMPNWNHALTFVTGKYWAKLDADDWWEADFIQDCYAIISKDTQTGMVCGRYIYIDENDNIIPNTEYQLPKAFKNQATDFVWRVKKGIKLFEPPLAQQGNGLIRTEILEKHGKYNVLLQSADTELYFRIGAHYKIHFIDKLYHYHRVWAQSGSRTQVLLLGKTEQFLYDAIQTIFDYYVQEQKITPKEHWLFSKQNQFEYNKFLIAKYRKQHDYRHFMAKFAQNFRLFPLATLKFYLSRIFER